MNVEKLKRLQTQVRIGGKGTPRRKKKVMHQTATTDDKKLQSSLKKLSVSTIPGIEEVNIIKDDLTVIHFNNPKAQASLSANTFAVTGHGETKKIVEMLPEILPQLGQETVVQLRMFANSMSGTKKSDSGNMLDSVVEEDDVPMLVSDFDEMAKLEAATIVAAPKPIVGQLTVTPDHEQERVQNNEERATVFPILPTEMGNVEMVDNNLKEVEKLQPTENLIEKAEQQRANNKSENNARDNKKPMKTINQEQKGGEKVKKDVKEGKDKSKDGRKTSEMQKKAENKTQKHEFEKPKQTPDKAQKELKENKKPNEVADNLNIVGKSEKDTMEGAKGTKKFEKTAEPAKILQGAQQTMNAKESKEQQQQKLLQHKPQKQAKQDMLQKQDTLQIQGPKQRKQKELKQQQQEQFQDQSHQQQSEKKDDQLQKLEVDGQQRTELNKQSEQQIQIQGIQPHPEAQQQPPKAEQQQRKQVEKSQESNQKIVEGKPGGKKDECKKAIIEKQTIETKRKSPEKMGNQGKPNKVMEPQSKQNVRKEETPKIVETLSRANQKQPQQTNNQIEQIKPDQADISTKSNEVNKEMENPVGTTTTIADLLSEVVAIKGEVTKCSTISPQTLETGKPEKGLRAVVLEESTRDTKNDPKIGHKTEKKNDEASKERTVEKINKPIVEKKSEKAEKNTEDKVSCPAAFPIEIRLDVMSKPEATKSATEQPHQSESPKQRLNSDKKDETPIMSSAQQMIATNVSAELKENIQPKKLLAEEKEGKTETHLFGVEKAPSTAIFEQGDIKPTLIEENVKLPSEVKENNNKGPLVQNKNSEEKLLSSLMEAEQNLNQSDTSEQQLKEQSLAEIVLLEAVEITASISPKTLPANEGKEFKTTQPPPSAHTTEMQLHTSILTATDDAKSAIPTQSAEGKSPIPQPAIDNVVVKGGNIEDKSDNGQQEVLSSNQSPTNKPKQEGTKPQVKPTGDALKSPISGDAKMPDVAQKLKLITKTQPTQQQPPKVKPKPAASKSAPATPTPGKALPDKPGIAQKSSTPGTKPPPDAAAKKASSGHKQQQVDATGKAKQQPSVSGKAARVGMNSLAMSAGAKKSTTPPAVNKTDVGPIAKQQEEAAAPTIVSSQTAAVKPIATQGTAVTAELKSTPSLATGSSGSAHQTSPPK